MKKRQSAGVALLVVCVTTVLVWEAMKYHLVPSPLDDALALYQRRASQCAKALAAAEAKNLVCEAPCPPRDVVKAVTMPTPDWRVSKGLGSNFKASSRRGSRACWRSVRRCSRTSRHRKGSLSNRGPTKNLKGSQNLMPLLTLHVKRCRGQSRHRHQ